MRRAISFVLSLVLAAGLCAGLTGGALAVEKDISATVGTEVSLEIDLGMTETPTAVTIVEGQLPPGLALAVTDGKLMLTGTPAQEGNYQAVIHVDPDDKSVEHTLRIRAAAPGGAGTAAGSAATPQGSPDATPGTGEPETSESASASPSASSGPPISKHPGGENISEYGTAMFVSRAEGAAEINWVLAAPNGTVYTPEEAEDLYSGLIVTGQGTETLTLYGVPGDMNGWSAECHFKNAQGGESISDRAAVTVNTNMLPSPVVSRGPEETFLLFGETTTLAVYATPAEGCTILYQWYQTTSDDPATATPIEGATEGEFTPPETDGTVYYCAGLRNVNNESVSTTAYTPLAAVTYGSEPPVPEHVHDFGDVWYHDDIYHWQQCQEDGEIANHATHTYTWTETVKPTARKQGERKGVCTVCGYETVQTLAAQKGDNSGRPRMTTVIALLMIGVALLLFGVYYYTRTSGGRNSASRRSGGQRRAAPRRSAPRQTRPGPAPSRRQEGQDQWRDGQDQWRDDQGQWQEGQDQWQEGQDQWQEGQSQWQDGQDQWQDDQGQWRDDRNQR